ncbi:oligosaccharide repeat unit polymerase, partial [Escherichia coli]|nr:oligosaccharide repeat unit polymerase [Escherichia coli]
NFWESFDRSWLYVFNNNGVLGYINGLLFGIEQFFSRIQLFSNAVVVYSLKHELANFVITNKVTSYWQEGIYGIIWNR